VPCQPLPDALRGEKWAFVQLPLGPLLDMLKTVEEVRAAAGMGRVASVSVGRTTCAELAEQAHGEADGSAEQGHGSGAEPW
jgi:hypothetical protein